MKVPTAYGSILIFSFTVVDDINAMFLVFMNVFALNGFSYINR